MSKLKKSISALFPTYYGTSKSGMNNLNSVHTKKSHSPAFNLEDKATFNGFATDKLVSFLQQTQMARLCQMAVSSGYALDIL